MKRKIVVTAAMILAALAMEAQSVKVVSPNGGESWALNSAQAFTWTSTNAGTVKVDIVLRNGSTRVGVIKSQVALSTGTWTWTSVGRLEDGTMVPAGTDYTVRIRDAANTFGDSSDNAFAVAPTAPVIRQFPERLPPIRLLGPRLEVSGIGLAPNADGFAIIFNYKNVGKAALPKASEVPVRPDFQVLLDYTETAKGTLYIPAFPAQPGWEQVGFSGGQIDFPLQPPPGSLFSENDEIFKWRSGSNILVRINKNKVLNMDSHELWQKQQPLALEYYYDLKCQGIVYDWKTRMLTIIVQLEGKIPTNGKFTLLCRSYAGLGGDYQPGRVEYHFTQAMDKNTFSFSKQVDLPDNMAKVKFEVFVVGNAVGNRQRISDINMNNNVLILRCLQGDECFTGH